jgi:ABC-type transport system involved in cytochrome bd biosynthesis fused ATPase/permease subunit
MSSVIVLYSVLAITILRGVLEIYEAATQRASRRRLEHELRLTLTHMLATTPPETVITAQSPDSTASMLAESLYDSGSATNTSVR